MICLVRCSNYLKSMNMLTMMTLQPKDALMTVGANVEALISVQTSFCQLSPAGWWCAVAPLCNNIFSPFLLYTFTPFSSSSFHSLLLLLFHTSKPDQTEKHDQTKTRPDLVFSTLPRTPLRVKDIPWFFWSLLSAISLSLSAYSPVALYLAGSPYAPSSPIHHVHHIFDLYHAQSVQMSFMSSISTMSTMSNCPPCPSFPPCPPCPTINLHAHQRPARFSFFENSRELFSFSLLVYDLELF